MKFTINNGLLYATAVTALLTAGPAAAGDKSIPRLHAHQSEVFQRVATFPVFLNHSIDTPSIAEIVASSKDGKTLVYVDGANESLGFVDIKNPARPKPAGDVPLNGEPTSVAVAGDYALVAVNTSPSFTAPSGELAVVDIRRQRLITTFDLGGQPDSVAISPDGNYAAVVIENERDEDFNDGELPQLPSGGLVIVTLQGAPQHWSLRNVDLAGVADLYPEDAEPEYVDINAFNIAVLSFQENNHIAMIYLPTGRVVRDFSAGSVDLTQIDAHEDDLIAAQDSLDNIPREPDGIAWLTPFTFATANEGDLHGGSRGFSIFDIAGHVLFDAGNELEHTAMRLGHYPEDRSENKGNEPENVAYGEYGRDRLLFVGSERASVVFVYQLTYFGKPELLQVLPTGVRPEGLLAIPQRNLFVTASEEDSREDTYRSVISIYQRGKGQPEYPTVVSANRADGTPIPWAALSGLTLDPHNSTRAHAVHDSYYRKSRIYEMDISEHPALIDGEIVLKDTLGKLTAANAAFPDYAFVNDDFTVNLDPEGIAIARNGGFWVASEGDDDPYFPNLLVRTAKDGVIEHVVQLPQAVEDRMVRFGFEGVASVVEHGKEIVYVAFQREWNGDPTRHVRIGRYDTVSGTWTFLYYPTEAPASAFGGWVGLSELTALGGGRFLVVERDNQAGADAVIKRVYEFSVNGLTSAADNGGTPSFPVVSKKLVRDLMPDLTASGGAILEKIEGMTVLPDGTLIVVNDNDGVKDSNGETQLLRIRKAVK